MVLAVREISKSFGSKAVLHNLHFSVRRGEVIGFLGLNGAGKTTTMRLITGYLKTHSGSISVCGLDPVYQRAAVSKVVGYLPENNPLYGDMTTKEFLDYVARVKGQTSYDGLITAVGARTVLQKKLESLSRGYRQRVGLIAAMMGEPDLLVLDEPTSGLDPIEQDKIREILKKHAKKSAILFSTHLLSEAEDIATRLIILHKGKIVFDGRKPKGKGAVEKLFKRLVS